MSRAMIYFWAVAMLCCCEEPKPKQHEISQACKRAFAPTLEAYEDAVQMRVGEECRFLDRDTSIVLVPEKELYVLCGEMQMSAEELRGCARVVTKVIYLNDDLDKYELVDASVHEWFHMVLECMGGAPDTLHLNGKIWIQYGPDSAEAEALASVEFGQCL